MNKIISSLAAIALLAVTIIGPVQAAGMAITNTLSSTTASAVGVGHSIAFTTATGLLAGDTIKITFDAGFTALAATSPANYLGDAGVLDTAAVVGNVVTITLGDAKLAGAITIGTGITATNPVAGNYTISVVTSKGDFGAVAIPVGNANQVSVTAIVDPILTFTLADYGTDANANVSLGTIDNDASNAVEGSGQDGNIITVTTNAGLGITVKAYDEALGLRTSSFVGPRANAAGDGQFNDVAAGAFPAATEAFGYQVGVGVAPVGDFNPLTGTTPVTLHNFTTSVTSGVVNVLYQAQAVASTPAGAYNDVITYTVTPTF